MQLIFRLKITLSKLLSTIINPIRKTVYTKKFILKKIFVNSNFIFISAKVFEPI